MTKDEREFNTREIETSIVALKIYVATQKRDLFKQCQGHPCYNDMVFEFNNIGHSIEVIESRLQLDRGIDRISDQACARLDKIQDKIRNNIDEYKDKREQESNAKQT